MQGKDAKISIGGQIIEPCNMSMSIRTVVDIEFTLDGRTTQTKTIDVQSIIAIQPRFGAKGCMIDTVDNEKHTRFFCKNSVTEILTSIRREQE